MQCSRDAESRAIERLIADINSIDEWRDRVGKRVIALFLFVFACAVCLLFYVAAHAHERVEPSGLGRPVPAVLRSLK